MKTKVTVSTVVNYLDRNVIVEYDIVNHKADIYTNDEYRTHEGTSKELYEENFNQVKRLARKEIPKLKERIANNRYVLSLFTNDKAEQIKANRHLANNQFKLTAIEEFLGLL